MKLLNILKFAEEYLNKYSFSKSRLESEKVISYVLELDRISLYTYFDMELTEEQKEKIKRYLRAMAREKVGFDEILKKLDGKTQTEALAEREARRKENSELLRKSIEYLEKHEVQNAKIDAEYIFAHVLGVSRGTLTMNFDKKIEEDKIARIRELLKLRGKERRPLQYLLGEWEFYGRPFKVDERVLIPRPDTEILVEQCKTLMLEIEKPKILDIGTGSGAIAITLAKELPESEVLAVDISSEALEVAVLNRELNGATNLKFLRSDLFTNIKDGGYDLIVSNPPYIPQEEYDTLMPEVKGFEPRNALTDNGDGYYFYRKISEEAKKFLKGGGYLAFEIGYNQAEKVGKLISDNGLELIGVIKDYGGNDRVVIGRKGEKSVDNA
jgi:release factor glutamine methyltransferase